MYGGKQFDLGLGNPGDEDPVWDPYHGYETFQPLTIHLTGGGPTPPPPCPNLPGDANGDGDLDLADFAGFQACRNHYPEASAPEGCEGFFANNDDDVNEFDFSAFLYAFTGAGEPVELAVPQPGAPRRWESGMSVGINTYVNLRSGNLLTTIPIVSWQGRGPAMAVALYHNSAGVEIDASLGAGWDLGPGWTMSYGGHIVPSGTWPLPVGGTATVVEDDGTRTTHTWNGSAFVAPAGIYETLVYVGGSPVAWRLTYKNQTKREYDPGGRLKHEVDASGNQLEVLRNAQGKITSIKDAPERLVNLVADANGRLEKFVDPQINSRTWRLIYDAESSRLSEVRDPLYNASFSTKHRWGFGYDEDGRITSLSDKENHAFAYAYACDGRLTSANDPAPLHQQAQKFAYGSANVGGVAGQQAVCTDRRGHLWRVGFDGADNNVRFTDPLGAVTRVTRDAAHEVDRYTDAMDRYWDLVHDARGNLTDVTDQYDRESHREYDALNNLTLYRDQLGNEVTRNHDDPQNPTLLTSVVEPPTPESDWQSSTAPAVTTIAWFGPGEAPAQFPPDSWRGRFKSLTDPRGVNNRMEHDERGQPKKYVEGDIQTRGASPPVEIDTDIDDGGRMTGGGFPPGGGGMGYDDNNNPTGAFCPKFRGTGPFRPFGEWAGAQYDGMDRLVSLNNNVHYDPADEESSDPRNIAMAYDVLGRPTSRSVYTEESGTGVTRTFEYFYDDVSAQYTVSGVDGNIGTFLDEAGRPRNVSQFQAWANYDYFPDGRPSSILRGNASTTYYAYDFENLRMSMTHVLSNDHALVLEYQFAANGVVESITESDELTRQASTTTFEHDARRRLYHETRVGSLPYEFSYLYDLNGNRKVKIGWIGDPGNTLHTTYTYDLDNFGLYGTKANRLMAYTTREANASGPITETGAYEYNEEGNPWKLTQVIYDVGQPDYTELTLLDYDKSGRLWRVRLGIQGGAAILAREFRYDSPRQRYLVRELDPTTLQPIQGGDLWSDYERDSIFSDYTVTSGTAYPVRTYLPGQWQTDLPGGVVSYVHTDLLGTTRRLSGEWYNDPFIANRLFSAFGEPISSSGTMSTRYGYAGRWGYQENAALSFLHVGARYYDPSMGRFLQRDPVGVSQGQNVYSYVRSKPTRYVDLWGSREHDTMTMELDLRGDMDSGMSHEEATRAMANRNGWALVVGCGIAISIQLIPWILDLVPDPQPRPELPPTLPEPLDYDWDRECPGPDDIDPY